METNLTNKKKYNFMLMFAGVCFVLFTIGKIAAEVADFLYFLFNPNVRGYQNFGLYNPLLSIVPIILLLLILFLCLFMFIGKPKVLFSIFFVIPTLYYMYYTIINVVHVCMSLNVYNRDLAFAYIFILIYKLFASFSTLTIVVGFATAFILSLVTLIRKKRIKLWFIPGSIITLGFVLDLATQIIWFNNLSIMRIMADITHTTVYAKIYSYYFTSGTTDITAVLSIISSIFLVIGAFLIGKANNK